MNNTVHPASDPPEFLELYDFSGETVFVSEIVNTNMGPAVYIDGGWCSVDWDPSENMKPLSGVTCWAEIPALDQRTTESGASDD